MAGKHLIQFDSVMNDKGDYAIGFWQDLNGYQGLELIEEQEKFIKRALKYRECVGNQVILDILSDFDINVNNSTIQEIENALNRLKRDYGATLEIRPMKAPKNTKVIATTKFGHEIYIDSDNYICLSEGIIVWRKQN